MGRMGRMGRRQICNTFYIYIMKIFLTAFFLEKKFFFMRVIWVAGRTRRPIIGSLQKSRENPGCIGLICLIVFDAQALPKNQKMALLVVLRGSFLGVIGTLLFNEFCYFLKVKVSFLLY